MDDITIKKILQSWIGAPFLRNGETKFGCDCLGFVVGIYNELGCGEIVRPFEEYIKKYRFSNNLKPLQLDIVKNLRQSYDLLSPQEATIGDLVLFFLKKSPIHFGIFHDESSFYCANNIAQKVLLMQYSDISFDCRFIFATRWAIKT